MKSYTDIEQSRKLAEILPIESADMYYWCGEDLRIGGYRAMDIDYDIPCWSFSALLDVLPKIINNETLFIETSPALWHLGYRNIYTERADNPIDACVNMIIHLNKLNLLNKLILSFQATNDDNAIK